MLVSIEGLGVTMATSAFAPNAYPVYQPPGSTPITASSPSPLGMTTNSIVPIVAGVGGFAVGVMLAVTIRRRRRSP